MEKIGVFAAATLQMDLSRNELFLNNTDSFIVVFGIEIEDQFSNLIPG